MQDRQPPLRESLTQSPERITMTRGLSSIEDDIDKLSLENVLASKEYISSTSFSVNRTSTSTSTTGGGTSGNNRRNPSAAAAGGTTVEGVPHHRAQRYHDPHQQQRQPPPQPAGSSTTATTTAAAATAAAAQAGILASGLAWVDRQREKRRRQYLQLQAEQQLQKIAEAAAVAAAAAATATSTAAASSSSSTPQQRPQHADSQDRTHHQTTTSLPATSTSHADDDGGGIGGGGSVDCSSSKSRSFESDHSGSAGGGADNGGGGGVRFTTRRRQPTKTMMHADVSKSGEGASGRLDLSNLLALPNDTTTTTTNASGGVSSSYPNSNDGSSKDDSVYHDSVEDHDNSDDANDDEFPIPEVRVDMVAGDDDPNNPFILTSDQMHQVASHVLPKTVAFCRWRRLYGLGRDGDSFEGCLRIIGSVQRTLLVVRTSRGSIFGGYAESPWHSQAQYGDARFFGSAAACLYSFSSSSSSSCSSSSASKATSQGTTKTSHPTTPINVYKWTGKNRYIQLCDLSHKMIAFGGGGDDGAFGLCVQEDFQRGSTGPCDTFDNEPLCDEDNFDIVDVEFWEFLTGVF